jgi:pimeloyl-ACP methyl ester carboxylesterase
LGIELKILGQPDGLTAVVHEGFRFVTVDNGVKLEVLDWGGSGRAVVLLAGYRTAHEYDDIAPKLSAFCHVYGITGRGFGASSRPDSGYTPQRSAGDVLQVLDALKLDHPVLAGHSFGGLGLLTIGARHPALVAGLVFLDSGDDPTLPFSAYGVAKADTKDLPGLHDGSGTATGQFFISGLPGIAIEGARCYGARGRS